MEESVSHRENLASKFSVNKDALDCLTDEAVCFLDNEKIKSFYILFDDTGNTLKGVIFKRARLIKNYFFVTGEENSEYKGKIVNGELFLELNQIENYVSKKEFF